MKKIIFYSCLCIFIFIQSLNAQVGIGTNTPNSSAQLDITSSNKGLLIPRVSLINAIDNTTIPNPPVSLMVYNTSNVPGGANPISPGFYYWTGASWVAFFGWGLSGNSGLASNNFIGSLNNWPLAFRTNNNPSGIIYPDGFTAFGSGAGQYTYSANSENTAIGHFALQGLNGQTIFGFNNTAIGSNSLVGNQDGSHNTAVGFATLNNNSSGNNNIAIGESALQQNNTGNANIAIGNGSLASSDVDSNLAIGYAAMELGTPGLSNTAVGHNAFFNIIGKYNTGIGYNSGYNLGSGNNNTVIGYNASYYNQTGNNNTALGYNAGVSSTFTNLNNTTAIGAGATVTASNQISFGDDNVTSWLFGRSTLTNGVLQVGSNNTNGNGAYLTAGGTWTNTSDSTKKDRLSIIDGNELLKKVMQLNISQWYYKGTNERHIGPMAQQFYRLFSLGNDNKSISSIDPAGIALRVIQEQQKEIDELKSKLHAQTSECIELKKRIEKIESILNKNGIK